MQISDFLMFKNNYVEPTFYYGILCYVTISTSSWYASMIGFIENNKSDDDDDDDCVHAGIRYANGKSEM